jgi:Glu-tRNA(Gln) amidotransferase subunit E-like FAD-binding protein
MVENNINKDNKLDIDYEKLNFKCGIEIHQQLETNKLFCNCPSIVHDENPDIFFSRKLRAVVGETGVIDDAAAHEQKKDLMINYEGCSTSSCLIEMDEEPPMSMNQDALKIVLQIAQMLNAKIVDEIQVMRKTVVNGSNVSGFQRTALVAYDGFIDTSIGKVRIPTICIEEEAAKQINNDDNKTIYRLDRLGVPLIEIATEPDIKTAEHAKETAEKIGMILRSTGKVKRGIGTIRQDVNISILGKSRIEIKGFQDLRTIPLVINNEIIRQKEIYDSKKNIDPHVRKANADGTTTFLRPMPGSARMYPETDVIPIIPKIEELEKIELIDEKIERFQENYELSKDLAKAIVKSEKVCFFEECTNQFKNIKPAFIAETIISVPKEIKRKENNDLENITDNHFHDLFSYLNDGHIAKESVVDILVSMNENKFNLSDYKMISEKDLEKEIKNIVDSMKDKPIGAIMGEVMKKFKGKVDGKKAQELIKKNMN